MADVVEEAESDLRLRSGVVRVRQVGPAGAPLVICVHGLSANVHAFDYLASRIVGLGRRVAAFDLRGRGRSPATPPGSYGLESHARDVLEVADRLGAERFDCVGWSLGALISITTAGLAPGRPRTITLLDQVRGITDAAARQAVLNGLDRLDAVVAQPDEYVSRIRANGIATPWSEQWRRMYAYELVETDGGFTPATSKAACAEDLGHEDIGAVPDAWPRLTMPVLVVRALDAMGGGLTLPDEDLARFREAVPGTRVIEMDRNHFGVMTDDRTAGAITELFAGAT
jgi:pimeloyl-ACP methyl ester carboxylesterase